MALGRTSERVFSKKWKDMPLSDLQSIIPPTEPDKPLPPLPREILHLIITLADDMFQAESRKLLFAAVTGGITGAKTSYSPAALRCPFDRLFEVEEHVGFPVYKAELPILANPPKVVTTGRSEFGVMSSVLGEDRSKAPFVVI
ncbi:hypothetical protein I350_05610 [Cryptococcus amylolentus CBS 6273]|uniref:Uncharacterized protein n=1 Tax=Cryptococcus amylolentus CBS 6273 TaxID=1296118 RepID=A0A1E3JVW6_9TREE|nr:hypothetical protein I350_05610 [Cryptococcus amylolentus CBS 6273]